MPALKLDDVPARVAAWHNRHPLARRIDPSQVEGLGELSLPFASDRPAVRLRPLAQAMPAAPVAPAPEAPDATPAALPEASAAPEGSASHEGPDGPDGPDGPEGPGGPGGPEGPAAAASAAPSTPATARPLQDATGADGDDGFNAFQDTQPGPDALADNAAGTARANGGAAPPDPAAEAAPPPEIGTGAASAAAETPGSADPAGAAADLAADAAAEPGAPADGPVASSGRGVEGAETSEAPAGPSADSPDADGGADGGAASGNTVAADAVDAGDGADASAAAADTDASTERGQPGTPTAAEPESDEVSPGSRADAAADPTDAAPGPEPAASAPADARADDPAEPADSPAGPQAAPAAEPGLEAGAEGAAGPDAADADRPETADAADAGRAAAAGDDATAADGPDAGPDAGRDAGRDAQSQAPAGPANGQPPRPGSLADRLQAARRAARGEPDDVAGNRVQAAAGDDLAALADAEALTLAADAPQSARLPPAGPAAAEPAADAALADIPGADALAASAAAHAAEAGDGLPDWVSEPAPRLGFWQRLWARWFGRPAFGPTLFPGQEAVLPFGHAGRLLPLFDGQFLWPVSPKKTAAWAALHGVRSRIAQPGLRHRRIEPEPLLQRQARSQGTPHAVELHSLSAAISLGDRRLRVLVSPDGDVLGARALDPLRVGGAGAALVLALGGIGWQGAHWVRGPGPDEAQLAQTDAEPAPVATGRGIAAHGGLPDRPTPAGAASTAGPAASGSAEAGSADPAPHEAAASAPGSAATAAAAVGDPGPAAPAASGPWVVAAEPPVRAPGELAAMSGAGRLYAEPPYAPDPKASGAPAGPAAAATPPRSFTTRTPPPAYPERRASGPLAQIRPQLSDEARAAARAQSEAARTAWADRQAQSAGGSRSVTSAQAAGPVGTTATPPAPAQPGAPARPQTPAQPAAAAAPQGRYAVVVTGGRTREPAEAHLVQMQQVRALLPGQAPERLEVVRQHGLWHAAQWPFNSQADAEAARRLLAARGLEAQIVPF